VHQRLLLPALGLMLLLLSGPANAALAAAPSVTIVDFAFQQPTLTVNVGDTVTWTNNGSTAHTATSDTGAWDSAAVQNGASFSYQFTSAGTFAYHCTFHSDMHGVIIVQGPEPTARDGRHFSDEPVAAQMSFIATWSAQAPQEWVREHEAALPPPPATPTPQPQPARSAPAPPTPAPVAPAGQPSQPADNGY
jgi:plastocyanin